MEQALIACEENHALSARQGYKHRDDLPYCLMSKWQSKIENNEL